MDIKLMLEINTGLVYSVTNVVTNICVRCETARFLFEEASANSKRVSNFGLH